MRVSNSRTDVFDLTTPIDIDMDGVNRVMGLLKDDGRGNSKAGSAGSVMSYRGISVTEVDGSTVNFVFGGVVGSLVLVVRTTTVYHHRLGETGDWLDWLPLVVIVVPP